MKTPPFTKILQGCTARKVLEIGLKLKETKNMLVDVRQAPITKAESKRACEIFIVSGDLKLRPIVALNDDIIGNGKPGPIFQEVLKSLWEEIENGTGQDFIDIDYMRYNH